MKKLDEFLNKPGGAFLMNLLAQSGYSTMPGSPLGAVGRASQATQQQMMQQGQQDMRRQLIESQVGLNKAQTAAAQAPGGNFQPLTSMAKLRADFQRGMIERDVYEAQRDELMRKSKQAGFDNTKVLRDEFGKSTDRTRQSLQSLSSAANLIQSTNNPIADLAGFISTIKSIDNSTVREGELAAFNAVQGFARQLEQMVNQTQGKGFSESMRRDIADTINRLREPLAEHLAKQQEFYRVEADKYGLDPTSVTGAAFIDSGAIDTSAMGGQRDPSQPMLGPVNPNAEVREDWDNP